MKKVLIAVTGLVCLMMGSMVTLGAEQMSPAELLARSVLPFEVYEENDNKVDEYKMDEIFNSATVCGEELSLGMTYQDIVDKGIVPKDERLASYEFKNKGLGIFGDFVDKDGNIITLTFEGEEGTMVKDDSTLFRIVHGLVITSTPSEMSIGKINTKTSKLDDILLEFGYPYTIGEESDGSLVLEYINNDKHQPSITFHIDPDTTGIVFMALKKQH